MNENTTSSIKWPKVTNKNSLIDWISNRERDLRYFKQILKKFLASISKKILNLK